MRIVPAAAALALVLAVHVVPPIVVPITHEPIVPVMHVAAQDHPPGIRPGAWMVAPHACTMAFVVRDAEGALYMTTAGHCVDRVGQAVEVKDEGVIGHVVAFRAGGVGEDYALVKIAADAVDRVSPSMAGWDGPTGIVEAGPHVGGLWVRHYGYGTATWFTHESRCRTAFSSSSQWTASTYAQHGVILWGDSGSPSMTADGRALGINTHLSLMTERGTSYGTRLTHALERLEAATGLTLSLVTGEAPRDECGDA